MEPAKQKLNNLLKKCEKSKIQMENLDSIIKNKKYFIKDNKKIYFIFTVSVMCLIIFYNYNLFVGGDECNIYMPQAMSNWFRPPESCEFCQSVSSIARIENVYPDNFEKYFAYNAIPVIVTDAMKNWTAVELFDFYYFRDVYEQEKFKETTINCQFFPYKTDFKNLYEAFSIDDDRVNYRNGAKPWYFGWSNCNEAISKTLRQHYDRPYFLPPTSENNAIDWIFIGGPGMGAHMHVDNVRLPSWQAQLKGSKEWILAPPPECYYQCSSFKTVVKPGEMIILDTNRWYHQTIVQPGAISVTIGAEYD